MMTSPITQIQAWLKDAEATGMRNPNAVTLCTLTEEGYPDGRIVLLKHIGENTLTFFTNGHSCKGRSLAKTPKATMVFYWDALGRQIRVTGDIQPADTGMSDAYFAERPRESQIGAWASLQSESLDSRDTFLERIATFSTTFEGQDVPRPPHWQGYLLTPVRIEFWVEKPFRLHERTLYTRANDTHTWQQSFLYP